MEGSTQAWTVFVTLVVALLVLDLLVLNRRSHVLGIREALGWSIGLVSTALLFGVYIYQVLGSERCLEYYTGYLIELALSVDNLFVFILIFQYFCVPAALQPRILKWGIFGAMVMRGVMIAAGVLMLERFEWITYVFGVLLVFTGVKMMMQREEHLEPERNPVVRLARTFLPFTTAYDGQRFFTRTHRRLLATPLLLVLLVVEWSDLVFAIDSIPAIFAVTRDPFIVYSSNIFAILGLRALFFVLASGMDKYQYLKPGVALILVFVGFKMTFAHWVHIPTTGSLAVVLTTLALAVLLSIAKNSLTAAVERRTRARRDEP